MTQKAVLLLGTNIGNRKQNLEEAAMLVDRQVSKLVERSSVYQTAAWGVEDQEDFLNQVITFNNELEPEELLERILSIERRMGRERKEKWGPRLIDIDILFIGIEIIDTPALKVPHPELQNRRFTLEPLNELMPDFVHPKLGTTINILLANCPDTLPVTLYTNE